MKKIRHILVFVCLLAFSGFAHAGPVNVNTADAATLASELQGVGEKTAEAIVAYREQNGPFKTLDDLKKVKGIGDKLVEKNKDNIQFSDKSDK
ncbi:MAG TPA: ComEA family DNA-binding protein [Gammaproteobacteria bacterium]